MMVWQRNRRYGSSRLSRRSAGGLVARVGDEAVGLQQARRADELVRVPPERRAGGRAAGAQDALVQAVQLARAPRGDCSRSRSGGGSLLITYGLIEWYCLKNCVMSTIRSRITGRPGQRAQRHVLGQLGDLGDAGEAVLAVDVDRVRAAHALAAGAAEGERVVLRLRLDQGVEQHAVRGSSATS